MSSMIFVLTVYFAGLLGAQYLYWRSNFKDHYRRNTTILVVFTVVWAVMLWVWLPEPEPGVRI